MICNKGNILSQIPAKGVTCDIDVGDSKPVAQRARRVPPQLMGKLYELLQEIKKIKLQPEVQEKENKNEEIYNEEIPTISNMEFNFISTCKEADK